MGTGGAGAFAAYGSAIKIELQRFLAKRSELKRRQYKVDVNVWMANDGRMTRYELIGTTTDADLDESLRNALAAFPSFSSTPPEGLPQPVRLRITASGRT
jgi:TonB family protein